MNSPCQSGQNQDKVLIEFFLFLFHLALFNRWVPSKPSERKIIGFIFENQVNFVTMLEIKWDHFQPLFIEVSIRQIGDCIEKLHDFRSNFADNFSSTNTSWVICRLLQWGSPFIVSHILLIWQNKGNRRQKRIHAFCLIISSVCEGVLYS